MAAAMPRFARERVSRSREEKEGYLSIIPGTMPEQGVFMVNPSARRILDLCDGHASLGAIYASFASSFDEDVSLDQVAVDVNETLRQLDKLGLVEWMTGLNPFREQLDEDTWMSPEGVEFRVMMEQDLDLVVRMLARLGKSGIDTLFVPASYLSAQYTHVQVRSRMFEYLEVFFVGHREGVPIALVSMRCQPPGSRLKCGSLGPLIVDAGEPLSVARDLVGFGCSLLNKHALELSGKVRALLDSSAPDRLRAKEVLEMAGFSHQVTLRDELGPDQTCELWDRWLDPSPEGAG